MPGGNWNITSFPSVAVVASASMTAPANFTTTGMTLRLRSLNITIAGTTSVPPQRVVIRDGAASSGTVLWDATVTCSANNMGVVSETGLDIRSTSGNGLCVEFAAASAPTATQETIAIQGDMVPVGFPPYQT